MLLWLLAGCICLQRIWELRRAAANRRWILARGGKEYNGNQYPLFFLLHGAWLCGWLIEAQIKQPLLGNGWSIWFLLFLSAQALRYWCIFSLGPFWNTRILVLPGASRVKTGPYRYFPHPNYLAVSMELMAAPMIFGAWVTAGLATLSNAALLLCLRIPAENRAVRINLI